MQEDSIQQKIIEEVKDFALNEIRPYASEFEEKECIPRKLINEMAQRGYLAACFPKEFGGLGLDAVYYGLLTEEIGKACASTRSLLTVHTSLVGETILRWGTEEQKNNILPLMARGEKLAAFALTEPEVGTDAKSVRTNYKKNGNCYIINGKKKWITLSDIADLFLVIASDQGRITAFLIDRKSKGITTNPIKGLLANRATHIAEVTFENVLVPEENILGNEGNGFNYIVNSALDYGRYSVAWGGLGIAQAALEEMIFYSRNRKQFNQGLYSFQLIQKMIGDSVTKIHAARALCLNAGKLRKEKNSDAVIETTIAKYFTSTIANQIASDAVQVHGGNGCYNKYPVERLFRESKILEIIEGTSQIQQEIIASFGLRKYYKKRTISDSTKYS
jgi:alkylation response protein AidB-like acyl-CoA dehydrogenase